MRLIVETLASGMLAAAFIIAGIFFLRFWRASRDYFFLAFAASFLVKGCNAIAVAFMDKPSQASPWNYVVGLLSSLLIVLAIVGKNLSRR